MRDKRTPKDVCGEATPQASQVRLKSSEKCERGMMRMSAEGGQLHLPPLSFIIDSKIPPKVIVSHKG